MKTIWKYPLALTDRQTIRCPKGSMGLTVQLQGGVLTLWMEVDPDQPEVEKYIHVVGTGNPLSDKRMFYLATVQMLPFVWHIYEEVG